MFVATLTILLGLLALTALPFAQAACTGNTLRECMDGGCKEYLSILLFVALNSEIVSIASIPYALTSCDISLNTPSSRLCVFCNHNGSTACVPYTEKNS